MKLLFGTEGELGTIRLSNPPHNRLTHPVFADRSELTRFLDRPELKAVMVTGEGRNFCAGADLAALREQVGEGESFAGLLDEGKALLETLGNAPVPVMAVIRGSCLGAGLEIALACHFRFASSSAMLGFPEAEQGLMPGFGATVDRARPVTRGVMLGMILSGRMVSGDEARDMGLVDWSGPRARLEAEAVRFLKGLTTDRDPHLIRAVMQSLRNATELPRQEALRRESLLFYEVARRSRDEEE
jgi:enoyl-CoA hydratase